MYYNYYYLFNFIKDNIHYSGNPLLCSLVRISFHAPWNCGMTYPRQCVQVDMTWVPSKSASISILMAGTAPIALLVLHGVVGGGNNLPSGDPNARIALSFYLKKNVNYDNIG